MPFNDMVKKRPSFCDSLCFFCFFQELVPAIHCNLFRRKLRKRISIAIRARRHELQTRYSFEFKQ